MRKEFREIHKANLNEAWEKLIKNWNPKSSHDRWMNCFLDSERCTIIELAGSHNLKRLASNIC